MAQENTGAAYDLSLFEAKPRQEVEQELRTRKLRVIKNKRRVKAMAPIKVLLSAVLILGITCSMIYSRVVLTELTDEINTCQSEIKLLEADYVRLSGELEAATSLKNLEESAVDELGLSKIDASQVEYIRLAGGDQIAVSQVSEIYLLGQQMEEFLSLLREYISS